MITAKTPTTKTVQDSSAPTGGVFAALWLPTDQEGSLLRNELAQHLDFLKHHQVTGVLALGSTGEFPQFDLEQRKRALATVAELAAPLQVIANVSDIRPKSVAALGRFARELGLSAIAVMPPGFFPSRQEDALAHFRHAAESSELPTFLYNFPELTGTRIDLETVAAFADEGAMAGIKQSGGGVRISQRTHRPRAGKEFFRVFRLRYPFARSIWVGCGWMYRWIGQHGPRFDGASLSDLPGGEGRGSVPRI